MSELNTSDANEEQLSSEAEETKPDSSEASSEVEESQKETKEPPFHEHPRWKEIQEKSERFRQDALAERKEREALQSRLEALESHLTRSSSVDEDSDIFETVKKADPRFGKLFEETVKKVKGTDVDRLREEIRQEVQQELQASQLEAQIRNKFDSLHSKHNVPEFWRSRYEIELQQLAARDSSRFSSFSDMEREYENIHRAYQDQIESIKRETTRSYANSKKEAASKPSSQPKGAPASKKDELPRYATREEMVADIARRAVAARKR